MINGISVSKSKRFAQVLVAGAFVFAAALGLTACGQQQAEKPASEPAQEQQASTIAVTVKIDSSAVESPVAYDATVEVAEGATVLDALEATGVDFSASASQYGNYVSNIGGLAEREHGSASGWMFTINGDFAEEAADACVLSEGDVVVWEYVAGNLEDYEDAQ